VVFSADRQLYRIRSCKGSHAWILVELRGVGVVKGVVVVTVVVKIVVN
jgi:hypothetical protein